MDDRRCGSRKRLLRNRTRRTDRLIHQFDDNFGDLGRGGEGRALSAGRHTVSGVDDDVKSRLSKVDHRGLGRRQMNDVAELTSRMDSSQIPVTLDRLGIKFDPNRARTQVRCQCLATGSGASARHR